MHYCKGLVSVVTILFLLAVFNSQLNALIIPSGNSAFETADSIMGATNLIHMFARFVGAHIYLPILILLAHINLYIHSGFLLEQEHRDHYMLHCIQKGESKSTMLKQQFLLFSSPFPGLNID